MYMGELARLAIVKLMNQGVLLAGKTCDKIHQPNQFYTKYVSEIEG